MTSKRQTELEMRAELQAIVTPGYTPELAVIGPAIKRATASYLPQEGHECFTHLVTLAEGEPNGWAQHWGEWPTDQCISNDAMIEALRPFADAAKPNWRNDIPKTNKTRDPNDPGESITSTCLSDVATKAVDWLWRGRIARGKLTVIAGDPGEGKSLLTHDIEARVTTGGRWPCGEGNAPLGTVIILSAEDDPGDTIKPRLLAAGADTDKCIVIENVLGPGGERTFDLTQDLAMLERLIAKHEDAAVIKIDPINAYMGQPGKLNTWKDSDLRGVLAPLAKMAERCNVALIAVCHLNKNEKASALNRLMGSVAMGAAARSVYLVKRDEEDPEDKTKRRYFLPIKNNIGPDRQGFAYKLVEKPTGDDVVPYCVAIEWEHEHVTVTAAQALSQEDKKDGRRSGAANAAMTIIEEMLRDGPKLTSKCEERLDAAGISAKSQRTAKQKLGVTSSQPVIPGPWYWSLPTVDGEVTTAQGTFKGIT